MFLWFFQHCDKIPAYSMCVPLCSLFLNSRSPLSSFCNNCSVFQSAVFSLVPNPRVQKTRDHLLSIWSDLYPVISLAWLRPAGLLQHGVVYHRLFSIRPVLRSNTSQSLLGSTWLQIKASHYPTGCCVVISACEAAMCLQAAGHILGGCCAQLR